MVYEASGRSQGSVGRFRLYKLFLDTVCVVDREITSQFSVLTAQDSRATTKGLHLGLEKTLENRTATEQIPINYKYQLREEGRVA